MKEDLFTTLKKYRKRENSNPVENFITEAFAWILNNYENFATFFYNKLLEGLKLPLLGNDGKNLVWETQVYLAGVYPDMRCQNENLDLIFEHKAWSELHKNQLQNYREKAKENTIREIRIILITASKSQHYQSPDLALCWEDIYGWITEWQKNKQVDDNKDFIFGCFKELLVSEGMGPPAPISHEAIISYYPARGFEWLVLDLLRRVKGAIGDKWATLSSKRSDTENTVYIESEKILWGRLGLGILDPWDKESLGLFAGFMLDGTDHHVKRLTPYSPDCSIIITFGGSHDKYPSDKIYNSMLVELEEKTTQLGWDFHNQLENYHQDGYDKPNKFHPIHIRMPMLELLRGTVAPEEQEQHFIDKITEVLQIIVDCDSFWQLREKYSQR